ncbi:hypothetical protein XENTR_v10016592 [Xenopus tropicalis]|nr:hypothetical protein XENTR_v10016592 [Xenopus tropicalis]
MHQDGDCGMTPLSCGNGKLRQWLIDQIDSGKYPGLVWENEERSIFRIPWKHAGKQDYNREEDAALFKAWALFKGKYREGIDKPDPPTWKTRLRCALNKSNDFEELVERSQLDISDPYKVYKIIPEGSKKDFAPEQPHPELPYQCTAVPFAARSHLWQNASCENNYQVTGSFYACTPTEAQTIDPGIRSGEAIAFSDCRLHISLYYRDTLVEERTTVSQEGCRISHGHCYDISRLEQVVFPYPEDSSLRKNIEKVLSHLDRGVILWLAPDGMYARRMCQSRIYWEGPLSMYSDRPNKLERDIACKLFDTQQFLSELQAYALHGRPVPRFQIVLCFGEEFPDAQRGRKLITAHVEPVFARQLVGFAEQNGGHFMRGYDFTDHISSSDEYHRTVRQAPLQE